MSESRDPPRLRRELLLRLMLPLLALVAASGIAAAYFMQRMAVRLYDQWLLDAANSLAAEVYFVGEQATLELPAAARAMLAYDDSDDVSYSIMRGDQLIAGSAAVPVAGGSPQRYEHGNAYDAASAGRSLRVARVDIPGPSATAPVQVRVAETTRKRERMRSEILLALLPLVLLLGAAAAAIHYAVGRTLRPLEALAGRWNRSSHSSLDPIDERGVPRELVPFAAALNDLLSRLRAMLARERQFSATVAHQLRTPLAGLQLGLDRAEQSADLDTARATIAELKPTSRRLGRLVQQLLALGRIGQEEGRMIEFVRADLAALVQETGTGFAELAARRGIALELEAPTAPLYVVMHPDLLAEAIANLLDNALRYTPGGGTVAIEFGSQPPSVSIADSGPGIAAAQRALVFGRFVRGNAGATEGSGLGLAIVRDIAELHGGRVTLQDSEWRGLRITLEFPEA